MAFFEMIDFGSDETTSQFLRRRRRILATGKQAIVHLIEATRRPNYVVALIIVVLAAIETALIVSEPPPRVYFKRMHTPEPEDLAALRSLNHVGLLRQCSLPDVASEPKWRILTGPDAFSIWLPSPWMRTKLDTANSIFGDATATFSDRRDNYLRVSRVAEGSVGRSFIGNAKPTEECEISKAEAGSLWLFYTLHYGNNDVRYEAMADAITTGGRRYKLDVNSWSGAKRDSLVMIASKAILNQ